VSDKATNHTVGLPALFHDVQAAGCAVSLSSAREEGVSFTLTIVTVGGDLHTCKHIREPR